MRKQFYEQEFFCVMCRKPIPPERLRYKSITCSDECKKERKRSLYVRMSGEQCMFCRKPTSPAEQTLFRRFRKWAEKNPAIAFAEEFKTWEKEAADRKTRGDDEPMPPFTYELAMDMLKVSLLREEEKKRERARISSSSEVGSDGPEGSEMQDSSPRRALGAGAI